MFRISLGAGTATILRMQRLAENAKSNAEKPKWSARSVTYWNVTPFIPLPIGIRSDAANWKLRFHFWRY
jgi:hypothetical protein